MKIKCISILFIILLFNSLTASAQKWLWGTAGNEPPNGIHSNENDCEGYAVAIDAAGNSYLTGFFEGIVNIGIYQLIADSNSNEFCMFLSKYDANGNVIWAKQAKYNSSSSSSFGNSIAVDGSGNTYVAGYFIDTVSFDSYELELPYQCQGTFLVKYDTKGNVVWAKQSTYPSPVSVNIDGYPITFIQFESVTTDKSNNVYLTGTYTDTVTFDTYSISTKDTFGLFYSKFDANGNVIWLKQPKCGGYQALTELPVYTIPNSITTDKFNNLYITGGFANTITFGTTSLVDDSDYYNVFIAKFDSDGNSLWAKQPISYPLGNPAYNMGYSVCTDKYNNVYLTGIYTDSIIFGTYNLYQYNYYNNFNPLQNIFLAKYDPDGNTIWAEGSTNLDGTDWTSYEVATDTINNVYIVLASGANGGAIVLGPDTINMDIGNLVGNSLIAKFDSSGKLMCNVPILNGGDDNNSIAVAQSGNYLYFGGDLSGGGIRFGPDSLNIEGEEVPFMAKWQPCFACDSQIVVSPEVASICPGLNVTLTVPKSGLNYSWSPSNTLNTSIGDSVVANPISNTIYTVTGNSSSGCALTGSDTISIMTSPNKPSFIQHNDTLISTAAYDNQWYRNDSLLLWDTSQILIISTTGNYYVEVNNEANGCTTSSDTINITSLTGIDQLTVDNGHLTVYPNPTSDQLTIISNQLPIAEIDVTNELGQVLLRIPITGFRDEIDLSEYPGGIYFISVTNNSGRTVVPVMKE